MDIEPVSFVYHSAEILILLGIAGLTIPFLHKIGISPVLGYLLCGVALGPHGLAYWLHETGLIDRAGMAESNGANIRNFGELGVIFLMFMIGLKLPLQELWRMRHHILGLGSLQIILTGVIIFVIARYFGNTVDMSILLGACFALSSTAVVMQLLEEKGQTESAVGRLTFSILLMQDLAVIPILVLLGAFAAGSGASVALLGAKAILIAVLAVVLIYFLGRKVLEPLLSYLSPRRNPEWLMSVVLFLVIGTSLLTELAGMSAALGAFLAGFILAETKFKEEVQNIIAPVKGLLMGIFFLSIGMMIDIRTVLDNPLWLVLSVVGIGALKAGILFGLCLTFGLKKRLSAETAILMGQGGEFVFVIVTMAQAYGILPSKDAQFFMLVTALSLMATPFVSHLAPKIAAQVAHIFKEKD